MSLLERRNYKTETITPSEPPDRAKKASPMGGSGEAILGSLTHTAFVVILSYNVHED